MRTLVLILVAIANLLLITQTQAQVPRLVHYQGELMSGDGSPFSGTADLHFSIFETPTGERTLWSEVHKNVEISAGNYEVLLGSKNPLNLSFYEYYLEVDAEGEAVAASRIRIVGSGYNYRLSFLFAAYTIVWVALFIYVLSMSRRQKRITAELQALAGVKAGP